MIARESGSVNIDINMPCRLTAMAGDSASTDYSNCVILFAGSGEIGCTVAWRQRQAIFLVMRQAIF